MKVHPLFHETPDEEEHAARCFVCIFYRVFGQSKLCPAFPIEAFKLFADVIGMTIYRKYGSLKPGQHVSCKEILDALHQTGQHLFGSLAPMVFSELGLRTSKDLDLLVRQAVKTSLYGYQEDDDRFANFDVDLIDLLRNPPEL